MKHGEKRVTKYINEYERLLQDGKIPDDKDLWTDELEVLADMTKFDGLTGAYKLGYMVALQEH